MAVGTGGAILGGAALSGIAGASASSKAARAQQQAADAQVALEREIYEDTSAKFAPFYDTGLDFQNALRYELLGGPRPTFGGYRPGIEEISERRQIGGLNKPKKTGWRDIDQQRLERWKERNRNGLGATYRDVTRYSVGGKTFDTREAAQAYQKKVSRPGQKYQGFQATPGYNFMLEQGLDAIDGSAASRGNVFSGATMKAAQNYGTGLANQEYGTFLNRLTGQAASGQAAAGNIANAGANYASGAGNALAAAGNAQAAGYIGQANALNGFINNGISAFGFMNQPQANTNFAPTNSLRPVARPF